VAVAVIQDWLEPETDRSTARYDSITEELDTQEPIDGLRMHSAGFTGNGFRIIEVWDSFAQFERFTNDRLMPLLAAAGNGDATPPTVTHYELHRFRTP
jgi:hypothetical protein